MTLAIGTEGRPLGVAVAKLGRRHMARRKKMKSDWAAIWGFLRFGRSSGYSSHELWLIRHPTHRVVAPPPRSAQGSRIHSVRDASSRWIQDGRWKSARIAMFTKAKKTRGLALLLRERDPDRWDKTIKT